MAESVSVDSTQIIDGEEGALKVSAVVTLPDFDSFFNQCINETKERAKNDEDFNKKLLRALYQKTRRSETSVTKEYEIDLTKAETEEWSDADVEEYIKKYAVEKEIEAYCMRVVLLEAPDIEEQEGRDMKKYIRITAFILSLCLIFPVLSFGEGAEDEYERAYRQKVSERYKESFSYSTYYKEITNENGYYYKQWADNVENKSGATKAYLWCVNQLLDKKLNRQKHNGQTAY